MNLYEFKAGDVVICKGSSHRLFTVGREYLLVEDAIINDDGNPEGYCRAAGGLWNAEFKLKKPLEVKEEFDINKYKPTYSNSIEPSSDGELMIEIYGRDQYISKQDAIAIAKHFKLTGEL